ncbi:zwei Ig domain protein zig-8-like isoform X2 [Pomacea canaliculata]|uniref:zwei Ig domain protein zig-8-like isoform X2 n=1 Tax=Pomacea canaliculata TaxID=400727 RepID=UPI000D726E9B|nr:zwei Ig domain protein zig-8-like isoform X2 [Pomacea canaliculata]
MPGASWEMRKLTVSREDNVLATSVRSREMLQPCVMDVWRPRPPSSFVVGIAVLVLLQTWISGTCAAVTSAPGDARGERVGPGTLLPEFLPTPSNVTVRRGALAILHCWVKHLGSREVAWRRISDDQFLTIGKVTWVQDSNLILEHLRKTDDVTTWDLILRRAQPEHAGDYECQITTSLKHVHLVTLSVIEEPSYRAEMLVYSGHMIHLVCNVSTENATYYNLHWFKDGVEVNSFSHPDILVTRYQIEASRMFVSDLIIDNASQQDSGVYACRTSNDLEVDSTKITVLRVDTTNRKREEAREDVGAERVQDVQDSRTIMKGHSSYFGTQGTDSQDTHSTSSGNSEVRTRSWCSLLPTLLTMWTWWTLGHLQHCLRFGS